ncbi:Extracellular membrane protein, CFEM domain protein [Niveomyces insectorum RCEF 264]|uniref:Extracellular membrane protein, CFEM domain protein n=1 Tax=Niveomyces insectorum RCEF 264 TaxID=1081102 RepID=A0A167RCZ1_9HYPO|nr:Extracellular membrane protein, CFEM domain protein [Niveomyces insectorum RCEF 264]
MRAPGRVLLFGLSALLLPQATAAADNTAVSVLAQLPSCAARCLVSAIGQSPCSPTNMTCMCTNEAFLDDSTVCIQSNCTVIEALSSKNVTSTACGAPIRSRNGVFRATSNSLGILTGCFLITRLAYRLVIARTGLAADDWAALAGTVVGVPSTVLNIYGLADHGLGRDIWTLPLDNVYKFLKFFYIIEIHYFVDITLLKLTLLLFYLRIFPSRGVRRLIWGTIAATCIFGVAFLFMGIFQCRPISYYWTRWDGEHEGHCLNINALGWANAAISIALDFWMLAIPLWQLRKLRLHWKKKVSVFMMFCVGTFVTVVSILRLHSLLSFANTINPTWDEYGVTSWSTIEVNVGIICASLPTVRLVLVHFFPRAFGSSTQRYYYNSNNNNNNNYHNGNSRTGNGSRGVNGSQSGNRRASRNIPLVSITSNAHKLTNTTITTIQADNEDDDDYGSTNDTKTGGGGVVVRPRPSGKETHSSSSANGSASSLAEMGVHGPQGAEAAGPRNGAGGGNTGILYSRTYGVEYGSDYHDEARLVHERSGQVIETPAKIHFKSTSRGSESSAS